MRARKLVTRNTILLAEKENTSYNNRYNGNTMIQYCKKIQKGSDRLKIDF